MKWQAARDEMCTYVDKCFCSDYEYNSNLQVIHEACGACGTIQEMFEETDPQTLRDCWNENLKMELGGKVLKYKCCTEKNVKYLRGGVSTIELLDMVLKGLKQKYEQECQAETHQEFPDVQGMISILFQKKGMIS